MKLRLRRQIQDPGVLSGLHALALEFPKCRPYILDMQLYAMVGKDRRKLGLDYVARAKEHCEQQEALFKGIEEAFK